MFNPFFNLTKQLSCTVAITFTVWGVTAKLAQISFSFPAISQIEDSFLATSVYDFFSDWELSPFHLKHFMASLQQIQTASLSTWALGPLWNKMWLCLTTCNTSDRTKGWYLLWAGLSGMARNFIMLFRAACNSELMNCLFLEFSLYLFFWPHPWHVKVPRPGIYAESLTHCAGPGIGPVP